MNLFVHIFIHIIFSLLAGFLIYKIWRKFIPAMTGGILGGFLIDADHLLDYFLANGFKFSLVSMLTGEYFSSNEKVYILFHGWEYVILLIIASFVFKNIYAKYLLMAISLGMFFHLFFDVAINDLPFRFYSIIYRAYHLFDAKILL